MIFFLLGVAALLGLMLLLGTFSRAQVATIKEFGLWFAAIGGAVLAVLLLFTGRGVAALWAFGLLGPMIWGQIKAARSQRDGGGASGPTSARQSGRGPMSREEAWKVLGLTPGASAADIRAAHRRLMRAAHPDAGGSDWLAARINQARDLLLG